MKMTKKVLTFLLLFLPLMAWAKSAQPETEADYHLDMGFKTNGTNPKQAFSWYEGDAIKVTAAKKEATSSKEAEVLYVEYYVDGDLIHKATEAPFQLTYDSRLIGAGRHLLLTKVYWKAKRHRFVSDFKWNLDILPAAD